MERDSLPKTLVEGGCAGVRSEDGGEEMDVWGGGEEEERGGAVEEREKEGERREEASRSRM